MEVDKMEYWDVFLILAAVVSLFSMVLPFFTKLNRTLGELTATVEQMQRMIANYEKDNHETHGKLYSKLDDHERRISRFE